MVRTGLGVDSHRFAPGRRLVLGGVEIPHDAGLAGHSDADVLAHAVIDALLGAAGLGDIGTHFPDTDAQWKDDPGMKAWNEFLDKYYPEANRADASVMYAYIVAQGLVHVLKACGDDLTRANVMKQAASIKDLEVGGLLPGVKVNTSATDFAPLSQLQLIRFKGETWERFGEILSGDVGG